MKFLGVIVPLIVAASGRLPAPLPNTDLPRPECGNASMMSAPRMIPCDNGGIGASQCETKRVVSVGGIGSTSGCGISCSVGTYACCQDATFATNASCGCRPEPPRGPWTPEVP